MLPVLKPRPYQREAKQRFLSAITRTSPVRNAMVAMATGLGKTVLFSDICSDWVSTCHSVPDWRTEFGPKTSENILILAHREELVSQAQQTLRRVGIDPVIDMALSQPPVGHRAVVACVPTLSKDRRLERYPRNYFGLIIVDECHHSPAKTYRKILRYFANKIVLGVTATPKRQDGIAQGSVFDECVYDFGIRSAIQEGWLVDIVQKYIRVEELDFSSLTTRAGDFSEDQLSQILLQEKVFHQISTASAEIVGDRPTIVFSSSVAQSKRLCDVLNRYRPNSAQQVDGKTDKGLRRSLVRSFKRGEYQYLVNCGVFLEGFDAPNVRAIVCARPTTSTELYVQMVGRGTRPLAGVIDGLSEASASERIKAIRNSSKKDLLVVDFVGNSGRHKIVSCVDILGGKLPTEEAEQAKKEIENISKNNTTQTVAETIERVRLEAELEREERGRINRRFDNILADRVRYREENVSIFHGDPDIKQQRRYAATEKQVKLLVRLGVPEDEAIAMGKWQASRRIEDILESKK